MLWNYASITVTALDIPMRIISESESRESSRMKEVDDGGSFGVGLHAVYK